MVKLKKIRELVTDRSTEFGREKYISSASGLVQVNEWLYVIADDELHLGVFSAKNHSVPGFFYPLIEGELSIDPKVRKKEKPDFEAIVLLPTNQLLIIPSGSTVNRSVGVLVQLNGEGLPDSKKLIDFSPLYQYLSTQITDLNIEGATIFKNRLKLFQRGNSMHGLNAIIDLDLNKALVALESGTMLPGLFENMVTHALGTLYDVKLTFTDATTLDELIIFTAAAEDTLDTYHDAPCAGSVVGLIDQHGKIIFCEPLEPSIKAEGLIARRVNDTIEILCVTDADDSSKPAVLYSCAIPKP